MRRILTVSLGLTGLVAILDLLLLAVGWAPRLSLPGSKSPKYERGDCIVWNYNDEFTVHPYYAYVYTVGKSDYLLYDYYDNEKVVPVLDSLHREVRDIGLVDSSYELTICPKKN